MEHLVLKYTGKLVSQKIAPAGAPLACGRDAEIFWNRDGSERPVLDEVMAGMNINSLIFSRPAEPYHEILNILADEALATTGHIVPQDSETRTFLHEIPVLAEFSAGGILSALRKNKGVFVKDHGIVTFGTISPEQAFITYSSICFSSFVKFFADILNVDAKITPERKNLALYTARNCRDELTASVHVPSSAGPFSDPVPVIAAMDEAGKATVYSGMVDSFFGNISYRQGNSIFISQTGSSLDELPGYIDRCPTDDSMTTAITASSEFGAHRSVFEKRDIAAILHGHPRFTVIMSMACGKKDCPGRGRCHVACPEKREIFGIPVVPGEVGSGPTGIVNTLPSALIDRGAIIWGHGIFAVGKSDYREAFDTMKRIEIASCNTVLELLA